MMMSGSDSFAAHSFRDVTHHVVCSAVIAVPVAVVVHTLHNIESIKRYGVDSRVIDCCVMENLVPPDEVGAVRRCTLHLPPYTGKLVREKLTHYVEHRHEGADDAQSSDAGELRCVEMSLEYVRCEEKERRRSPFEPSVDDAVRATRTLIRISNVTRTPHRCFVEMDAECVLRVHQGRHVSVEEKLQDKACQHAVTQFWHLYLDAQLYALEKQVCKEAFPEVESRVDTEYRAAFTTHEEVLCDWAVDSSDTMRRHVAIDELESVLVWWARALEAYRQQKMLTEIAEARVERTGPSALALAHPLPPRFTDAEKSSGSSRRASESSVKSGGETDVNNPPESAAISQPVLDAMLPAFLPTRTFAQTPLSPSAFGRSNSHRPSITVSDVSRQSTLLPPDRRHTAMPKKSLVSGLSLSKAGPSTKMLPSVSSFSPSPNKMAGANSSATAHSGRRKPTAAQPPHLLQHVQRRASNVNNSSASTSRQDAASTTPALDKNGGATGFFFSQFFTTPVYTSSKVATTTAAGTSSGGAPTQRSLAMNAVGAAASSAPPSLELRAPSPDPTPALAASAATQASSPHTTAVAAPPEAVDPFHPDMARHLFSLTGVLQEDMARRVFLSLSTQDNASNPHLSADGLKSVLRYLDRCGLHEGGALNRADAAACDEAYRAEVQRCYYEQNIVAAPSAKARKATAHKLSSSGRNSSGGAAPSEAPSTLSVLAARREATRREGDEVALDRLVQYVLSRFAFQRKRELNYDEFQLALLYLWNN
ncbi:unspecified product [Leptomonas pyrrhocoris]|uniref:Unspecified product n=1 Tax=Leptomonas pyrrhocoris TaxID=157538 RepID=A0A0M9G2X8_LEPPY|nr:unspecified product [Leptomonas pyrrhocoris]KPA81056.1 unspecified product [Leptomonas pyrrhocoris]|eukprot:XP_015659495.1 unspecified product [Leptomonas pyrrhocoris]